MCRDARAEIHPHPPSTIAAWEALFGDDFSPAATPRRAVPDGVTAVWRDGDPVTTDGRPPPAAEIAWVDGGAAPAPPAPPSPASPPSPAAELDPATLRALEAIGYLR